MVSERSTGMFSVAHRGCCFSRLPHVLCSMLKLTDFAEVAV